MLTYGSNDQTKEQDKAFPSPFCSAKSRKKGEKKHESKALQAREKKVQRRSRRLGVEVSKTVLRFLAKAKVKSWLLDLHGDEIMLFMHDRSSKDMI